MDIQALCWPIHGFFRTKRMRMFWQRFAITPDTRVLDVGGTIWNWSLLPRKPRLVLVNVRFDRGSVPKGDGDIQCVVADGRHLPFTDGAFGVLYSNSVIEHLGSLENQQRFANECDRVGHRYYVQTPNPRFPVEPHLLTPLIHWLPRRVQRRLLKNCTVWGLLLRPTRQECDALMGELCPLSVRNLQALFPDAEIWRERVLGLTKSLIAARDRDR